MTDLGTRRRIRSYVLRAGRMTDSQQRALQEQWPDWGLECGAGQLDFQTAFGRDAARIIEVGFGMGHSLAETAAAMPDTDFVGIEVHGPGVGKLLHTIGEQGLRNIRIYRHDAVEVLRHCIPDASVDAVHVFFPDPWHKKRHHKRRLIQPAFVALVKDKLKPDGVLHLATDWENYAEQMMEVLTAAEGLSNTCGEGQFAPRPEHRPHTKFEQRGERLGHGVWDLVFRRENGSSSGS